LNGKFAEILKIFYARMSILQEGFKCDTEVGRLRKVESEAFF